MASPAFNNINPGRSIRNPKTTRRQSPKAVPSAAARPVARRPAWRQGAGRGGEAVPVVVATAVQKSVPVQLRAVGNVEAYNTVSVKSQVTGVLAAGPFQRRAGRQERPTAVYHRPATIRSGAETSRSNLGARYARRLRNKREQLKRYAELVEKQYVSREQYDQIKTDADAAEAVVDADKAAVENAKVQLSYCYIYSPVNGRVGSLLVNEGNLVRVNDGAPLVVINQVTADQCHVCRARTALARYQTAYGWR